MKKGTSQKKKVFVGMSGGVDSSVSALLLKEAGYDVTGVFIKVWQPPFMECTAGDDRRDAMRVAASLDIPFITLNLEKEYKKEVVDYMIREYKAGRTPNPDVMCNRFIKFGSFLNFAKKSGADFVATGHYADIKKAPSGDLVLSEPKDTNKDQRYFLWTLTQDQLKHIIFPVGKLLKQEVRKIAEKHDLITWKKKDSQGLCFLGKVDMEEFLSHYLKKKQGNVIWNKKIIGTHTGAHFYTIGQRHGFTVFPEFNSQGPFYITGKHVEKNTITVSGEEDKKIESKILKISELNLIKKPKNKKVKIITRYRQDKIPATILYTGKKAKITFDKPQEFIARGQSVVIFEGKNCIGGAIID